MDGLPVAFISKNLVSIVRCDRSRFSAVDRVVDLPVMEAQGIDTICWFCKWIGICNADGYNRWMSPPVVMYAA